MSDATDIDDIDLNSISSVNDGAKTRMGLTCKEIANPTIPQAKNVSNTVYCSFCGKSQHDVKKLVAGPYVLICNECVKLCVDICKEKGIKI